MLVTLWLKRRRRFRAVFRICLTVKTRLFPRRKIQRSRWGVTIWRLVQMRRPIILKIRLRVRLVTLAFRLNCGRLLAPCLKFFVICRRRRPVNPPSVLVKLFAFILTVKLIPRLPRRSVVGKPSVVLRLKFSLILFGRQRWPVRCDCISMPTGVRNLR